ncbi:MAG TPA: DUF3857 domain-containing protein, partial [Terriglobales bacterium]
QHAAGAALRAGWNEILAKVGDTESADWHFDLRLTTPAGEPIVLAAGDDLATPPPGGVAATQTASAPPPAVRDLTALAKAVGGADYAWVLQRKQNFNTGDHDDANAFLTAIATAPNDIGLILDFAERDREVSRSYQNLEKVLATQPANLRARRDLGSLELGRNELWPARADLMPVLGLTAPDAIASADAIQRAPQAAATMVLLYRAAGMRPQMMAWADALRGAYPGGAVTLPANTLAAIADSMRRMGAGSESLAWLRRAHAIDASNLNVCLALADAERSSGALSDALTTLEQAEGVTGDPPMLQEVEARALAGLGREPEALARIASAVKLAPDAPDLRIAQGEITRHFGRDSASVSSWQAALALNPQDASLRDRLQIARGSSAAAEASFEGPYVQDLAKAMSGFQQRLTSLGADGAAALESGPVVVVADTNVANVFPSGNTGRYVQQIFRINNTSGADSLSTYAVTFDPAVEEVQFLSAHVVHADGSSADAPQAGDQPIRESVGYETFYNVRNKYVLMPPMRVGDFVEIAYRVLPTTLESLYGQYFGELDQFGSSAATLFQQYVVITPANQPLYFKAIRFPGASDKQTVNGQTVYRWSARDLPAQIAEPLAPPLIEQSPYIAVSSFQNWNQFGDWYKQLIRDTFVMDSEMVNTVHTLIAGKTTEAAKVDAIYRWVIENTHYVALEFGIHGYRPYPVTQVFHRRFGDCKDKASLLIAMLREAGVSSDFVLVRIRDLGVIDSTIPSVADFDHAIVYVPSLDRYLDGTAEFNGADELPAGDQRAFVLRIPMPIPVASGAVAATKGTDDPLAPVVTASQPPERNSSERVLNGQLDANGDLHFSLTWTLLGGRAPLFRQSLEVPDRQAGVLQAMLHDRLPGITILRATVKNDSDWDQPVEVQCDGVIPRFATVNGTTLLIPRQILPTAWLPQMASLGSRRYDVLTDPPEILQETMHLALPPGYSAALPLASQLDQPFADFAASATMNGPTLTLQSRIETKRSLITPEQYPAFRTFWAQVDAALGRAISTTPASTQGGAQ